MRCLIQFLLAPPSRFARLVIAKPGDEERSRAMGITDLKRIYRSADLAPGKSIIFAATASIPACAPDSHFPPWVTAVSATGFNAEVAEAAQRPQKIRRAKRAKSTASTAQPLRPPR